MRQTVDARLPGDAGMNVPNFSTARIAVIGDYIIDEYWHCTSSRISPEAPVPVCVVEKVEQRPGGAGNVIAGIKAMGTRPLSVSLTEPEHKKVRIVVGNHQVARADYIPSEYDYVMAWSWPAYKEQIQHIIRDSTIVVVSDYGRMPMNVIRETIDFAKREHKIVIVDPKRPDHRLYYGADLITPNEKEWQTLGGKLPPGNPYALVTRGEKGMRLHRKRAKPVDIPAVAREVIDVTGAGDTVVAVMAAALGSGYSMVDAARYANLAAGIAVEHFGTYAVTIEELARRVEE